MKIEIVISLITSIVAIIVASIGFFSSRAATKVDAMKNYMEFLRSKMEKLEGLLNQLSRHIESNNDSTDMIENIADGLHTMYAKSDEILESYAYLFTYKQEYYLELLKKSKQISLSIAFYTLKRKNVSAELVENEKNNIMSLEMIPSSISTLRNEIRVLIINELTATYKQFEDISLLKG